MKRYFKYEFKRALLPTLIITVFACVIYITSVINTNFIVDIPPDIYYGTGSQIYVPLITLMLLCTIVPVFMFSFKMSARQADCFYSIPLKREKIYLVKSAVGLFEVLIPYTTAFWLGFIATALKPNLFELWAFVPAYFISLPLAVLLFGVNAFVFTRANRMIDGIIFIALYSCAAALFAGYIINLIYHNTDHLLRYSNFSYWFTYSPLTWLTTKYDSIISGRNSNYDFEWLLWLFGAATGIGGWTGLFLTAKKEKAENAERVSDSLFGYRVFIPFYLAFMLANFASSSFIFIALFVIAAVVGYIIFRRTYKLKIEDLCCLGGALCLGIILSLFI